MNRSISPTPVWLNDPNFDSGLYITDRFFVLPSLGPYVSRYRPYAPNFSTVKSSIGIDVFDVPNQCALLDLFLEVNAGAVTKIEAKPENRIPAIRKLLYKCRPYEISSGVVGPRICTTHEFKQSSEEMNPWFLALGAQFEEIEDDFYFKAANVADIENLYGLFSEAFDYEEVLVDICFEFMGIGFVLPILNVGNRSLKVKKRAKKRKMSENGNSKKKARVWVVEKEVRKSFQKRVYYELKKLLVKSEFSSVKENPKEAKLLFRNAITKMKL